MTTLSLTPLFRQSIGFDGFSDLFDTVLRTGEDTVSSYPPYNIEKLAEHQLPDHHGRRRLRER